MTAPIETGAWSVDLDDDGLRIEYGAREVIAAEFNVSPSSLTRQPWADAYAPNDPPAKAWIENGFTYQCAECEHVLDDSGCDEDCFVYDEDTDENHHPEMVFFCDKAFCSQTCCDAWKRDRDERTEIRRDARAMFEALVPTAEIHSVHVGALGVCEDKHDLKSGIVRFKTPAMKEYGDWCSMCRTAHVAAPDVDVFKAAKAATGVRERKWHWRTWNLLLQIQEATDGKHVFQIGDKAEGRGLCVRRDARCRAFEARKWIECLGVFECCASEDDDTLRMFPAWAITDAGRKALVLARAEGIQVQ